MVQKIVPYDCWNVTVCEQTASHTQTLKEDPKLAKVMNARFHSAILTKWPFKWEQTVKSVGPSMLEYIASISKFRRDDFVSAECRCESIESP